MRLVLLRVHSVSGEKPHFSQFLLSLGMIVGPAYLLLQNNPFGKSNEVFVLDVLPQLSFG